MEIQEAMCQVVRGGNIYAATYARNALEQWSKVDDDYRKTQLLYVLSNIQQWRGPNSAPSRQAIKSWIASH